MASKIPTREALKAWANNYDKLWTAGDKQGWIDSYRTVVQGDAIRMLDPVGTPEKFGFKHCCEDSWDLFQPNVKFHIPKESLFVLANEVCWVMNNHVTKNGEVFVEPSIESFRFEPDGSLVIRTWYRIPKHNDGELGEMFQTYLPDNDGKADNSYRGN
ncbi:MAG: hypothetical protein AB8B48_15315 [Pseudomonadales bacterium]